MNKFLLFAGLFIGITPAYAVSNLKPVADAGIDKTVSISSKVTLSAVQSFDNDGKIKSYQWLQTKGTKVLLQNPKTAMPTFTSPKKADSLVFQVTVKDDKNATATDTVTITVTTQPVCELPYVTENNVCVDKSTKLQLNDSGITFCSDGAFNVNGCGIQTYPNQDAEFGRDVFANDDKDGYAGFSFTKISATGEKLPNSATDWACVQDNVTGLLWEVKTAKNADDIYHADNTAPFIKTTNQQKLCGSTNWRLPQVQELQSLVDYGVPFPNPTIDLRFFPHSTNNIYLTATPYAKSTTDVWGIYFNDGRVFEQNKNADMVVRLVSSAVKPTSAKRFVIADDGTEVLDTQTNLIWRRCVEGMRWNGKTCEGYPFGGMFVEGLQRATNEARTTGKSWRMPNVKELSSLLEMSQIDLAIDTTAFPATPNDQMWTSSSYAMDAFYGWIVHFYYGSTYYTYLEDIGMMRLVR